MKEKIITTDNFKGAKQSDEADRSAELESGESLLGEISAVDSIEIDLDRVREKTFNRELSDLVDRITSKEYREDERKEEAWEEEVPEAASTEAQEDDLLRRFHGLFYRALNLTGIGRANCCFNHFELTPGSIKDDLEQSIDEEMEDLLMPYYAVLYYRPSKKCFVPAINNISGLDDKNIIIDPNEVLYKNICDSPSGITVGSHAVNASVYLKKRFSISDREGGEYSYYFVSLRNLANNFYYNKDAGTGRELPAMSLFPVLIVLLNEEHALSGRVFKTIGDRLAVHFIFLARKLIKKTQTLLSGNYSDFANAVDNNLKVFSRDEESVCYIVKCAGVITKETLFVVKYLHIKLRESLSEGSVVTRIEKDRFLIFTNSSEVGILNRVTGEFNKYYRNIFVLKEYRMDSGNLMGIYCA